METHHETGEREYRRERETDEKDRLAKRLEDEGADDLAKILDECGQELRLRCIECQALTKTVTRCRKRYCPCCAPLLAFERSVKYGVAAQRLRWPLHVTLTIQNNDTMTTELLRWLLKCFRRLRQRKLWKNTVAGGWVSLEITNRGKGWHPHLHILADAEWLAIKTPPPRRTDSRDRKAKLCKSAATELGDEWADIVGQETASVKTRRCSGEVEL